MSITIVPSKDGFSIRRNDKKTAWSITIASMVPVKKRTTIEHYYILVIKDGKVIDRALYSDGNVSWIYSSEAVPNYVKEIAEDLLGTGDINKHSENKVFDNKFTRLGLAKK